MMMTTSHSDLTSSPPSVVISSRFSETRVTSEGCQETGNRNHFFHCGHFQVEPGLYRLTKDLRIPVVNVAPVFSKMTNDTVCTGQLSNAGGKDRIGFVDSSCLTYGGDMIHLHL